MTCNFQDTLTSRAEITDLSAKFKDDVVAVIGLGGTGAYVLDFLVKTPVKEIRAFDPVPARAADERRSAKLAVHAVRAATADRDGGSG